MEEDKALKPYEYEPQKCSDESSDSSQSSDDETSDNTSHSEEMQCQCGKCNYMHVQNEKEHVCCQARFKIKNKARLNEEGKMQILADMISNGFDYMVKCNFIE